MTDVRKWFILATFLAFVAGGSAGLVADRALQPDDRHPVRDPDAFLKTFERLRIGT